MAKDERVGQPLGDRAIKNFDRFLARDYWPELDFHRAVTRYLPTVQIRSSVLRRWNAWKENNGNDPGGDPSLVEALKEEFITHFPDQLDKPESLSRISVMASVPIGDYEWFDMVRPSFWTSWIQPGNDGYVFGVKGSGKTDFMCLMAEMLIERGGTVVSAIPLRGETDGYLYCSKGSTLLETGCRLSLEGVGCLVLLDEGFFSASGENPLKPEVVRVRQFLRLGRKLGLSILFGSQRESDILSDVRSTASIRIYKTDRDHPDRGHAEVFGRLDGKPRELRRFVRGIPPTAIRYKTEGLGSFDMDFDPQRLMKYLSDLPMEENQFEASIRWLDDRGFYFTREEQLYLAKKMDRLGIARNKIAKMFGVVPQTITDWLGPKR